MFSARANQKTGKSGALTDDSGLGNEAFFHLLPSHIIIMIITTCFKAYNTIQSKSSTNCQCCFDSSLLLLCNNTIFLIIIILLHAAIFYCLCETDVILDTRGYNKKIFCNNHSKCISLSLSSSQQYLLTSLLYISSVKVLQYKKVSESIINKTENLYLRNIE